MASPRRSFFRLDPFLLLLGVAVCRPVVRLARGGRLADVALHDLHFMLLFLSVIWSRRSPPGSAARWWARFGVLVAASWIIFGICWIGVGPPAMTPEAVVWGFAAFCVLAMVYFFINY